MPLSRVRPADAQKPPTSWTGPGERQADTARQSKTAYQAEIDSACEIVDCCASTWLRRAADFRAAELAPASGTVLTNGHSKGSSASRRSTSPRSSQSAHGPRADGEHCRMEAGGDRATAAAYGAAVRSGGPAARVINMRARERRSVSEVALAIRLQAFTAPAPRGVPALVGPSRDESPTASYPAGGETGGKDFIVAHSSAIGNPRRHWCGAHSSTRGRKCSRPRVYCQSRVPGRSSRRLLEMISG